LPPVMGLMKCSEAFGSLSAEAFERCGQQVVLFDRRRECGSGIAPKRGRCEFVPNRMIPYGEYPREAGGCANGLRRQSRPRPEGPLVCYTGHGVAMNGIN
jgi:hypothetical protein